MLMKGLTMLFSCFSLTCVFIMSAAVDTIAAGQILRQGESIVSAGESFELGFFKEKSRYWYLGIWYKKISKGTVVWVANTETPLTDTTSGVLKLDERGVLVILNQNNSIIWSSNTSKIGYKPVSQLLDSGNLVVRSSENDYKPENLLWQSFDHPGSTFLPGMKIGITGAGLNLYLSSWKSNDDPSRGDYKFQLGASGLEVCIKQGSVIKSRIGPWNGVQFSGMPYLKKNLLYYYTFVFNQKEKYYTYQLFDKSIFTRIVLNPDGNIQRLTWIDRTHNWILYVAVPADYCDTYALFGAYGTCNIDDSPVCGCLNGFVPKQQKDWDRGDWSSGCVRRTALGCLKGDGFVLFSNAKLPDMQNSSVNVSMTLVECKMKCLEDCRCMAFTNSDIRGKGSGCFLWFGDLMDIKLYKDNGQDLYVRMASSEIVSSHRKKQREIITITTLLLSGILLLLGLGISLSVWKKKRTRPHRPWDEGTLEVQLPLDNQEEDVMIPYFDMAAIANATGNFSVNNMLGEGGFGVVFKGILENGQEIAVKRLSQNSRQGLDEFMNEVKCIAKLQHRNLVKLLGYCIQLEETMLIYEYMPNKSLDYYIFDQARSMRLDWPKRLQIINGISRGLMYLHQDSRLRIIHRDLKLSDILLDNEMNPKISDFGMARIFRGDEIEANTRRVVGTYGYMSPEYVVDGQFSTKSDVFSFGVLVLEIISGKRNRGYSHPDHQHNLLGHAWILFKEERCMELIDTVMVESCNRPEILRSIHVGLLCVQNSPKDRPSMTTVVVMLEGDRVLPQPKEPGFFTKRKMVRTKSHSSTSQSCSCSANEMTISMMEGR